MTTDQQHADNLDMAEVIERAHCVHCDEPVVLLLFPGGPRYWSHDRIGYFCPGSNVEKQTHAEPRRTSGPLKGDALKQLLAAAILALAVSAHAQSKLVMSWTNPNTSLAQCSTTVTSACIGNQELTDTTVTSAPVTISSTIGPTASSFTIATLPSAGTHNYSLVQHFLDFTGVAQVTAAATTTVNVPSPFTVKPPTGFSGAPQ